MFEKLLREIIPRNLGSKTTPSPFSRRVPCLRSVRAAVVDVGFENVFFYFAKLFDWLAIFSQKIEKYCKKIATSCREKGYILQSKKSETPWNPDGTPKQKEIK